MKRHNIKDREITPSKMPDVRPLDVRVSKRIKPGQSPDAIEQLFFTEDNEPQQFDEILPAYARKLGFT